MSAPTGAFVSWVAFLPNNLPSDVTFDAAFFVGVTGILVTLFLVLARASQGAVRDDERRADERPAAPHAPTATDPGVPEPDGGTVVTPVEREQARVNRARRSAPDISEITTGALLANVAVTQGVFGVLLAAAAWYAGAPAAAFGITADPLSTGPLAVAVGLGLGLVLYAGNEVGAATADAAGVEYDERLRSMLAPDSVGGWLLLLLVVLPVIAGVEEFVFRAAAVGATHAGFGTSPWALAVISSLAFALGHGAQGRLGVVVTGALGFALAAAFILTGSFLVVFLAHYLVNALEFVVHELFEVEWSARLAGG